MMKNMAAYFKDSPNITAVLARKMHNNKDTSIRLLRNNAHSWSDQNHSKNRKKPPGRTFSFYIC